MGLVNPAGDGLILIKLLLIQRVIHFNTQSHTQALPLCVYLTSDIWKVVGKTENSKFKDPVLGLVVSLISHMI